jgi:hypothetical protein
MWHLKMADRVDLFQGGINCIIRASVHDHSRAFRRQLAGDGETDTLGGTGNESGFIDEF